MLVRSAVHVLLAVLAGLLLAAGEEGAPPSGNTAREPGLFAYEALTGGIFTIRPDGSNNREILPGGHSPEWSPNGTRLVYEPSFGDAGLWSARADGTDPRLIVRPQDIRSGFANQVSATTEGTWSPSGRRVAFEAASLNEDEPSVWRICTVAIDGSGLRTLRKGREPDWFPGGRRIAFIVPARSPASFSSRIAAMHGDGRGFRMLLGDAKGYRSNLNVSPDGRRLAFTETSSGPGYSPPLVRIMDLRTGRTTTIPLSKTGPVGALAWTPGGTRIAYLFTLPGLGQRAQPSSVYTIRPDGTGRTLLFTLPYEERRGLWGEALSWQPRQ
jgi:Tol biopolymer transport system component